MIKVSFVMLIGGKETGPVRTMTFANRDLAHKWVTINYANVRVRKTWEDSQ